MILKQATRPDPTTQNRTMVVQVACDAVRILHEFEPYIYCAAVTTNSVYIKFRCSGLGSLRIGDHPGKKKLRYKYNIRVDKGHKNHMYMLKEQNNRPIYTSNFENYISFLHWMVSEFKDAK